MATTERETGAAVDRRVVHAVCPHDCPDTCGMRVTVEDGRAVRVEGDATHPVADGPTCTAAAVAGNRYTLGSQYGTDHENFADARLIVCWGTNPVTSNPHLAPVIKEAQDKGAQLVVIDPRRTRTAERADWHLQPLPGSDAALALGLMHVIIAEGLHDADYVRNHTLGFDQLRERAAEYPPERVAALTGLAADDIVR